MFSVFGDLFIPHPWLALIPSVAFGILYFATKLRVAAATSTAWLCYAMLEFGNYMRWTCSGECNIRIDLLVIYPALVLLSVAAIAVAVVRSGRHRDRRG